LENSTEIPQNIKGKTAIWSGNPTTRYIYPKEKKLLHWRDTYTSHVYCSTIHNNVFAVLITVHATGNKALNNVETAHGSAHLLSQSLGHRTGFQVEGRPMI
jgi:hypothetical protein